MTESLGERMRRHRAEFERIRSVITRVDPDEPLTAREILELLKEHGEEFESAHQIATILGREAETSDTVEIISDQPYRYRIAVE